MTCPFARTVSRLFVTTVGCLLAVACSSTTPPSLRGTGELGIVIERASGSLRIVDQRTRTEVARVQGLGDLSHAAAVFSRDGRYAYVFGRDGGLSKVDLLQARIDRRIVQAGNSIGGAISQDGRIVVAQNYSPGGIRLFDADTLEMLSEVPTTDPATGRASKVVGLADQTDQRFAFALFEAGEIWVVDASDPRAPKVERHRDIGRQPYDGLGSTDGRWYIAGLFGDDGLALLDNWNPSAGVRRILPDYRKGDPAMPVFKMPHLRGWSIAGEQAWFPAIGQRRVLGADTRSWKPTRSIELAGQPVFVMARPDGRQLWVNFAVPDNDTVQVIDAVEARVVKTMKPCKGVLHFEFTARGHEVWLSCRDENRVEVWDTRTLERKATLPAESPSGIFFTWRASRMGM